LSFSFFETFGVFLHLVANQQVAQCQIGSNLVGIAVCLHYLGGAKIIFATHTHNL